jgi:hypothetical protein
VVGGDGIIRDNTERFLIQAHEKPDEINILNTPSGPTIQSRPDFRVFYPSQNSDDIFVG